MRILIVSIIVFVIDQVSKFLVKQWIGLGDSIKIIGDTVRLTHVQNEGIVFGFIVGNMALFTFISIVGALIIFYYLLRIKNQKFIYRFPLALIFGGALGNIFDRIVFGRVVDFMDLDIPNIFIPSTKILFLNIPLIELTRWPVLNIADLSIFMGMLLLFSAVFFAEEEFETEDTPKDKSSKIQTSTLESLN